MSQELSLQLVRAAQSAGYLIYVDADPTVSAVEALRGTVALKRTAPTGAWQKQDDGSSTNWSAINIGGTPLNPNSVNRYVDREYGSDTPESGSVDRPYQSLNYALGEITDASAIKPYVLHLAAGDYTIEGAIAMKEFVTLQGSGRYATLLGDINMASVSNDAKCELQNLRAVIINFNYTTSGATDFALRIINCEIQDLVVTGAGTGSCAVFQSNISGGVTNNGVNMVLNSSILNGISTVAALAGASLGAQMCVLQGTLTVNAPGALTLFTSYNGLAITAVGTPTITLDSTSYPIAPIVGAVTLSLLDQANLISYAPLNPANWAGTPPADAESALQRMESLLVTLNGGPIPV